MKMRVAPMSPPISRLSEAGSGLLEVLVLILVMSVGMLAMGKMHTVLIRDGGTANNRAIATSLAQEKLDDLRAFKWTHPGANAEGCGVGVYCYTEINDNLGGGELADGSLRIAQGTRTLGNTIFTLNWDVTGEFYYCDEDANGAIEPQSANCTVTPPGPKTFPDFKRVTITVSWTDQNDADLSTTAHDAHVVALNSVIYGANHTASTLASPSGTGSEGPKVTYTPLGVPDAMPIAIGDSKSKEAPQATPRIRQGGDTILTTFGQTTYSTPDNTITNQEDWATISCICTFNGTGPGMTPAREVWRPTVGTTPGRLETELGKMVTKAVGVSNPTGSINTLDEQLCAHCCRDHHETGLTDHPNYPKYDPVRYEDQSNYPTEHYESNGDHKHYRDLNNNGVLESNENVTSGDYLESCRFKRVDGIYRLFQDWRMADMTVMPRDGYLAVPETQVAYSAYLDAALAYHALGLGSDPAPSKSTLLPDRNFVELIQYQQSQILSRALYVDTIYQCRYDATDPTGACPSGSDPNAEDTIYVSEVLALKTAGLSWKKHLAFAEVNLTLFANWASSAPTRVSVTDMPVDEIADPVNNYYGTYSRGRAVGEVDTDEATISAVARRGNTSLTSGVTMDELSIDLDDQTDVLDDAIIVTRVGSASSNQTISATTYTSDNLGGVRKGDDAATDIYTVHVSNTAGVTCTATTGLAFSCTVPNNWSGNMWFVYPANEFYQCVNGVKTQITEANPLIFSGVNAPRSVTGLLVCKGNCLCPTGWYAP